MCFDKSVCCCVAYFKLNYLILPRCTNEEVNRLASTEFFLRIFFGNCFVLNMTTNNKNNTCYTHVLVSTDKTMKRHNDQNSTALHPIYTDVKNHGNPQTL